MKIRNLLMITIMSAFVLGGCASMSDKECASGNWTAIGYEDGARGYTSDQFGQYRQACAKHGIQADFGAYQQGRKQGLVEFCQPARGFDFGTRGGRYMGVCDASLEPDFLAAYKVGTELHGYRANVNAAAAGITARQNEQQQIIHQITNKQVALIDPRTAMSDRVILLSELEDLAKRSGELEVEIRQLTADRERYEQDLAKFESALTAYRY